MLLWITNIYYCFLPAGRDREYSHGILPLGAAEYYESTLSALKLGEFYMDPVKTSWHWSNTVFLFSASIDASARCLLHFLNKVKK